MTRLLLAVAGATALAAATPPTPKEPPAKPPVRRPIPPPPKATYRGTASCVARCKNGVCKPFSARVSGCPTRGEAERRLQMQLEAQVRLEQGQIVGSISFSITLTF
jgi:hypothetical protein